jgi:hypothetical protein
VRLKMFQTGPYPSAQKLPWSCPYGIVPLLTRLIGLPLVRIRIRVADRRHGCARANPLAWPLGLLNFLLRGSFADRHPRARVSEMRFKDEDQRIASARLSKEGDLWAGGSARSVPASAFHPALAGASPIHQVVCASTGATTTRALLPKALASEAFGCVLLRVRICHKRPAGVLFRPELPVPVEGTLPCQWPCPGIEQMAPSAP